MINHFLLSLSVLLLTLPFVYSHASLTLPVSTRHGGSIENAGNCSVEPYFSCLWFTQITTIPGNATVNDPQFRTYNIDVDKGEHDWSRFYPWRAPGTAPVRGSGCGVAGGSDVPLYDGGLPPPQYPQGMDGLNLTAQKPTVWKRGTAVEVGFALTANHGGGYSYRLCPTNGIVDETCFQKHVLKFAGNTSWIQYSPLRISGGPSYPIPLTKVTEGTYPAGSEWAKNPIPACNFCSQAKCGDPLLSPNYTDVSGTMNWGGHNVTYYGGEEWIEFIRCGVICAGEDKHETFVNNSKSGTVDHHPGGLFCLGETQFEEPLPGVSGFVTNFTFPSLSIDAFSIVDHMLVPKDIQPGSYLLSWRWDCEQSAQVWQNCADILIV